MIYSLMDLVEKNHRTFDEIRCFDTGKVWPLIDKKPVESKVLGMVSYKKSLGSWQEDTILDIKAETLGLLKKLGIHNVEMKTTNESCFHPKKQATLYV